MSEENVQSGAGAPPPRPRRGGVRRTVGLVVAAVAVIAAGVWGFERWQHARTHVSTDNAQVDGHIVPVLAKVGGYVERVAVDDNQSIHRGDLVVILDDNELQNRLAEAEADLAAARAAAGTDSVPGQVEAEASATKARRQALEARLASADANQERAAKDLTRIEDLASKQIASSQQLDATRAAARAAEAEVNALRQEVAAARASETSADAATRVADARLQRANAAVEDARLRLSYAHVVAPVSGVVSKKQVEVGQLVQPGQPLAAVVDDSLIWVTANLKETETSEIRVGQGVDIEVDAYPGCVARGTVESVSPATGAKFALLPPDNATGNFTKVVQRVPVRIALVEGCGSDRPLRPGMSVVADIETR